MNVHSPAPSTRMQNKPWYWVVTFIASMTLINLHETLRAETPEYEWEKITLNAPFAPRDGAGILSLNGKMFLLGGWNPLQKDRETFPRICNNEVWSSSDGRSWDLVKPNTLTASPFDPTSDWEGRHTAGYAVFRDRMWIIGGDCNQGHYQNDVWNSVDGKQWAQVNAGKDVPWGPRALHHTVVHDDRLWVMGGQTMPAFAPAEEKFYSDIWTSTDGVNWKEVRPEGPHWSARGMIGGSAVMNGRIWILGGGTYETPTTPERKFYNDVWSSSDGVHWKEHTSKAPWKPRQYHDVAVWDERLWVMEGYSTPEGNRNDVWHSSDGVNWTEIPNTPWKPRHAASLVQHNGSLWMIAGNNMEPDVWRLNRK
ncbi:hypothetical protein SH661x_002964 [Planctomicrobium sp. SH661]|uniref:hypothetical protein n=1 Tax=Planctomicrobium sp. SH661 TaxID=3448124 RepID=UPI003F5C5910